MSDTRKHVVNTLRVVLLIATVVVLGVALPDASWAVLSLLGELFSVSVGPAQLCIVGFSATDCQYDCTSFLRVCVCNKSMDSFQGSIVSLQMHHPRFLSLSSSHSLSHTL